MADFFQKLVVLQCRWPAIAYGAQVLVVGKRVPLASGQGLGVFAGRRALVLRSASASYGCACAIAVGVPILWGILVLVHDLKVGVVCS
jgi:hypothetical protein